MLRSPLRDAAPGGASSAALISFLLGVGLAAQAPQGDPGERLGPDAFGPAWVESMDAVLERQRRMPQPEVLHRAWNGEDGVWYVPPRTARAPVASGDVSVINRWGDPRIGVAFATPTDVLGVWVAGHGAAPAPRLRVVGLRGGEVVTRGDWHELDAAGNHLELDLDAVDRVLFEAEPALLAQGWFAIDDLRFRTAGTTTELDFEDLQPRTVLTGSGYAGLVWGTGSGLRDVDPDDIRSVHAPRNPTGDKGGTVGLDEPMALAANAGTPPFLSAGFTGPRMGDAGGGWIPPDTCGAAGPDHFVSIVNANLSVFDRDDGSRLLNVGLNAFWNQTVGDPRAVWDPHSGRFVILATDFSRTSSIFLAISLNGDPTGQWFKWSFRTDQGSDGGRWPDYPTLGVDARGIYTAAYMVGRGARMTIWAFDKAPLLQSSPTVGTATAWRTLPWEGAIQPCTTYGDPGSEYLVSRSGSTSLRLRRITGPLTQPQLVEAGQVPVPFHSSPPNAPALGSSTPLSTIDYRPMNAVYRNGSVYTAQGVAISGRAGVRWYEIDAASASTVQVGSIYDPVWHYFYPSIAVDARGDVALGFSGSHSGVYAGAFVTARLDGDPLGETAAPQQVKAGEGPWQRLDGSGRNRWGDYSHTTVDPVDDHGFWSIQEYAGTGNAWRTWITRLGYPFVSYGSGLAGSAGEPALVGRALPVVGGSFDLDVVSGSSTPSNGVLVIGTQPASTPLLGGTLLVAPTLDVDVPLPNPGAAHTVQLTLPNAPVLVDLPVFLQSLQLDSGAPQGVSFSPGLEIRAVSR